VPERVHYKVATLTYNILHTSMPDNILHTSMPVYLFNLLSFNTPLRCLHSSSLNLLLKPVYKVNASQPAFSFASPSVCNDFSEFVKSFESINILKCKLKTELFSRYD